MVQTFQSLNLSSSTPQIEKLLISFVSSGNGDVMLTNTAYADNLYSPAPLLSAVWSDAWLWRQNTNQGQVRAYITWIKMLSAKAAPGLNMSCSQSSISCSG